MTNKTANASNNELTITNGKIRFFEELASNGFPALNVQQYDGWLLRFSHGYTGRANSVSVLYPSTLDIQEKIDYCEECYKNHDLSCLFKLTDSEDDRALNAALEKRGYYVVSPTDIMVLKLSELSELSDGTSSNADNSPGSRTQPTDATNRPCNVVFSSEPTEEWLNAFFAFKGLDDKQSQLLFRQINAKVQVKTLYASAVQDEKTVACASAVIERGYMLLHNVIVAPNERGHGIGKEICLSLLKKAEEEGATYAYLQVMQKNDVALSLYKKLGFQKEYSYWYMRGK